MCLAIKRNTIEEIIAENSVGMSDKQKAEYWWELSQTIFSLLGKVEVNIYPILPQEWVSVTMAQYPTLTDIKIPDSVLYATDEEGIETILKHDWTNLVKYIADIWDCDKFGVNLYDHLCLYYKITDIFPVWGDTTQGYHGFNLPVIKRVSDNSWIARLIEPQTDDIFLNQGPLGFYIPRKTVMELGIKRILI